MRAKNNFRSVFVFPLFFGVIFSVGGVFSDLLFAVSVTSNDVEAAANADGETDKKKCNCENKFDNNSDCNNFDRNNFDRNNSDCKNSVYEIAGNLSDDNSVKGEKLAEVKVGGGSSEDGNAVKDVVQLDRAWLFVYFTGKGHDGLFYAWSNDGLVWRQVRGGKPFLQPEVGGEVKDRVMRAPSVCRGLDGVYHMVWTVGFESRSVGYASSRNMINWSKQRLIPVMEHEKGARNVWDPELFYDGVGKRFYLIWASTVRGSFSETSGSGEGDFNHRLYYTTTANFVEFAKTGLYWNPNHNVLDPLLVEDKSGEVSRRYLLFYKDGTLKPNPKKHLLLATGASPRYTTHFFMKNFFLVRKFPMPMRGLLFFVFLSRWFPPLA
ncbi:MAG: hypothetical protein LBT09_15245, partial [Planctomycetaceae bacterium]|nr:hypothetical protein [Planctomycetaceae bacterium]